MKLKTMILVPECLCQGKQNIPHWWRVAFGGLHTSGKNPTGLWCLVMMMMMMKTCPFFLAARSPSHMNGSSALLSRTEHNSVGTPSPVHVSQSDMALFKSVSSVGGGSDKGSDEGSR
jgi:hypothetical protein